MNVDDFITAMETNGKTTGDDLHKADVEQILQDCNLMYDKEIVIDDFAKWLISR